MDVKEPTDFYFDDLSWQAIDGQIANTTTWTIAGSGEIFGSTWDPGDTNNDMTEVQEGVFALTKRNIKLDAGYVYEFKVVANHSWDENYGANGEYYGPNVQIVVDQTGVYNLQIFFDRSGVSEGILSVCADLCPCLLACVQKVQALSEHLALCKL